MSSDEDVPLGKVMVRKSQEENQKKRSRYDSDDDFVVKDEDDSEIDSSEASGYEESESESEEEVVEQSNKNAPEEISSKKPVSRYRQVIHVPNPKRRDPRFDDSAGKLNKERFYEDYAFLEEYRDNEISEVRKSLKKMKKHESKEDLRNVLQKLQQQRAAVEQDKALRRILSQKAEERKKAMEEGKKGYFPKQKELRELAAIERFKLLEKRGAGSVDKLLLKKRKKLASKDRKAFMG